MSLFCQWSVMDVLILSVTCDGCYFVSALSWMLLFVSYLFWMVLFCQLPVLDGSILSLVCDGIFNFFQLSVMDASILSVICDGCLYFVSGL